MQMSTNHGAVSHGAVSHWAVSPSGPASDALSSLGLVDHHVHAVFREGPTLELFTKMMTESDRQPNSLEEAMFSQVGFAVRKWCAPILGLDSHLAPAEYWQGREKYGRVEAGRTLLQATGIDHYFIDTGFKGDVLNTASQMHELTGKKTDVIVRLETVAEAVALSGVSAEDFSHVFVTELRKECVGAIGLKSIVAYRIGLDFNPDRPTAAEVVQAAGAWLREVERTGVSRVSDPVLLRFLIWQAVDLNLPLQFHIGYGDPDLDLLKTDPLLMTDLIRQFEAHNIPVMLLHTYPFQRNAGYLAQMYRNVYLDVGLAINYTGAQSPAIIAETLELAPFKKILFSSDAWGLPELTYLGALLFRRGLGEVLDSYVARGDWSAQDAISVVNAIGRDNALDAYRLR